MKSIDARSLHIMCKRGKTVEELMAKYGKETPEELFEAIRKADPKGAEYFIKELKANQKKATKFSRRQVQRTEGVAEALNAEEAETGREEEQQMAEAEMSNHEEEPMMEAEMSEAEEELEETPMLTLEQLEKDEAELSGICVSLELEHKDMATRRREIVGDLARANRALKELMRLINENKEKIEPLITEYNYLAAQMSAKSAEITSYKEMLADARRQIRELRKVYILVYSDKLVAENGELPTFSASKIDAIAYDDLIMRDEAEALTVKEIKTIAKLILTVNVLKYDDVEYELAFDNQKVQDFYELVTA